MFQDKYSLRRYTLPNGDVWEEYLQETIWSSGPMMFLALKKNGVEVAESLWTKEEMNGL